nr:ribonucleoside-diphosphate reductase large subunit [Ipomoea batatas]
MLSGYLIYLWREYKAMGNGHCFVQMRPLDWQIAGVKNSTNSIRNMKQDSCNRKSNQQNLGTIKSSNLCTEIIEYTSPDETAVCNLASIALPRFVKEKGVPNESQPSKLVGSRGSKNRYFDFDKLAEAQQLNKEIFETIYYHALKSSSELAAKGILQPDMWGVTPSARWDWDALRTMIERNGVRNSLLLAPMPTASTSQILGNNECFEPYTSNIYSRRVLRLAAVSHFS